MKRYVLKFGGSSVETIEKMKIVASRIINKLDGKTELVVVVSAMGKTTSKLYNEARKITLLPNKRDLDLLLSTGEITSIAYLSIILNDLGYKTISLTGAQAKINTEGDFQNSKIKDIDIDIILKHLNDNLIVIVAGYQGVNSAGDITTLGREGSDTTAVTLAHYLGCPCEIYSDVEGVYEVDPRLLESKKHASLSYREMLLLSNHGAKVIATSAIKFSQKEKIPLYLASTFNEEAKGTIINNDDDELDFVGIVVQANIRILNIQNKVESKLVSRFENANIKVDVINNNLIAVASDDLILLEEVINEVLDEDDYLEEYVDYNLGKITIIGKIINDKKTLNKLTTSLKKELVQVFITKKEENRLSIFINADDLSQSIKILYKTIKGGLINAEET